MQHENGLEAAFGRVIRELRTERGLSQEKLAEAAGLHRNYVGLVERGLNSPSLSVIVALAEALGLRPFDLVRQAEGRVH